MSRLLALSAALVLPAASAAADAPPFAVSPAEAHGLEGGEREAALAAYRAHYDGVLEAFSGLKVEALDRRDLSKAVECDLSVSLGPEDFPAGAFVDGLPVRRAQPAVFEELRRRFSAALDACEARARLTRRGWDAVRGRARAALVRASRDSYCRADSDCHAEELADPCGGEGRARLVASETTDAALLIALSRYMPALQNRFQQAAAEAGPPGRAAGGGLGRCAVPPWRTAPLSAACVARRCRPRR